MLNLISRVNKISRGSLQSQLVSPGNRLTLTQSKGLPASFSACLILLGKQTDSPLLYFGLQVSSGKEQGLGLHSCLCSFRVGTAQQRRPASGCESTDYPTLAPLSLRPSPRPEFSHSSAHSWSSRSPVAPPAHGGRSLWRAGVTPTRVYVITRPAGRRREPRTEPVATSAAVCSHGSVARLCVRWLPGAGRGLRIPAGAGAAGLGAALSLELAAAGARARAPGISVPRGPAGGRLGYPHRAARPALAPRGCGVSACGACGSGPLREVCALRGLPGTR